MPALAPLRKGELPLDKSVIRLRGLLSLSKTLLIFFACVTSAALIAQTNTGSMSGTVTDPNGASVPGAKVTATNSASGVKVETQDFDGGLYVFPRLRLASMKSRQRRAASKD